MKYCKRIFAWLLSVSIIFSMLMINSVGALADDPPEPTYNVNFAPGSWTVNEETVTAKIGEESLQGEKEIKYSDIISLTGFNPDTMQVLVFAQDGFNTTLNVSENATSLSLRTNEGGLPDHLTFSVRSKTDNPPHGGAPACAIDVSCLNNNDKITKQTIKYAGHEEDIPTSWNEDAVFSLALQLENGYYVEPSTIQLSFEYDDPREGDPADHVSRRGQSIQLNSEQQKTIANALVSQDGYAFPYKAADYIGSGSKDNLRLRVQFSVNKAFSETVNLHFYKQDREDVDTLRQVETPGDADSMFLEDFLFNGNAVSINSGLSQMGGYVTEGDNVLTFMPGFGTKVEHVYYVSGSVEKNALDASKMTEAEPSVERLPTEDPNIFVEVKRYNLPLPAGSDYTILVQYGLSDNLNLRWSYLKQYENEDFYVENGKVYVEKIVRDGTTIYDNTVPEPPFETEQIVDVRDDEGGEVFALRGDKITLRLVPDPGYQLASASLNGSKLIAQEAISTFTVEMQRNLHFASAFVKMDDIASIDASAQEIIFGAELKEGSNAYDKIETGTLCLSIEANSDNDKSDAALDLLTGIDSDDKAVVASLDMKLTNVVFKGDSDAQNFDDAFWTVDDASSDLKELSDDVVAELSLGHIELADSETITVVREHQPVEGAPELEELTAYHWYENGELIVAVSTNKFSTYTFIKKPIELKSEVSKDSQNGLIQSLIGQNGIGDITKADLEEARPEDINLILSVKDAIDTMDVDVRKELADAGSDYNVGLYLDIDLKIQIDTGTETKKAVLTELPQKLTVTVQLPEELRNSNPSVTRIFKVVRKHDDKVELLDTAYQDFGDHIDLTFQTDKFSDYAVVYKDIPVPSKTPSTTDVGSTVKRSPKTGDNDNAYLPLAIIASLLVGVKLFRRKESL